MKKFILYFLLLALSFYGCSEDDSETSSSPQFNELGLQVGIPPVVNDTIVVNSNMNVELVNGTIDNVNISGIYELELQGGGSFSKVKKGTTIIDNTNGKLWVVKEVINENNGIYKVNAFLGMLGNLFQNAIVKASYNDNRAKQNSQYPYKLPSNQVTLNAFDEDFLWYVNQDNVTNQISEIPDDTSLGVDDDGNIVVDLNDFTLINGGGTDLKIVEGSLTLKPAMDAEMKFNPIQVFLDFTNPVSITAGSIKDFKSAIYLSADFDVTLGGTVNIANLSSSLPLTNFIIVVPVGCCAFIELELDVLLKTTLNAEANFDLSPKFTSKNDFVATSNYGGLETLPNFDLEFNNLENIVEINENYNVNSNLKFEIIPKASVYFYGLVGPSAELIPYLDLSANLDLDGTSNITTWDAKVDYGLDSRLALDINTLGETSWIENSEIGIQQIAEIFNENLYEENLYKAPENLTITLGNNQSGQANTQLSSPIEIEVKDNLGNPLPNVYVFFDTTNGSFTESYKLSDAIGLVANNWTLGDAEGDQTAVAYVKDGSGNIIQDSEVTIIATAENGASINPATNPLPSNGATDISITGSLEFTQGANTPSDATFRLYFDTNPNPTTQFDLGQQTSYSYSNLQENTTYYWYVETLSNTGDVLATSEIWSFTTVNNSSGNVYVGDVVLTTQQEVNDFGNNNYSGIEGSLRIGESGINNNINNLSPLSSLNGIYGEPVAGFPNGISIYNTMLTSLNGLDNLNSLESLDVYGNNNLFDISQLSGLTSCNSVTIGSCSSLTNLTGLHNIQIIDALDIWSNDNLTDLNLTSLIQCENFIIEANGSLSNLDSLSNLQDSDGFLVSLNSLLSNFCGLNNLVLNGDFELLDYYIIDNLYNPTEQDFINGNCSQ